MDIRRIGIVAAAVLGVCGCGSTGSQVAGQVHPPTPINLTVYVNDSRISVSPTSAGAGPIIFVVTNQAAHAESVVISRSGQSQPIASTAPINPQGATQLSVDFTPGRYTIDTAPRGSTDASLAQPSTIRGTSIRIGRERANPGVAVLEP